MIPKIVERFVDLLEKSVITRFTLVILTFGPMSYLYVTKSDVPDSLLNIGMFILGYFLKSTATELIKKGKG